MKKISFKFNSSAFKHLPTYFLYNIFCVIGLVYEEVFLLLLFNSSAFQAPTNVLSPRYFSMYQPSLLVLGTEGGSVVATHSWKHSERQCRSWSAVDYTGRPKAESPLGQDPDQFLKTWYTEEYVPKPASPSSLKLVWTKEKKDTIKFNPWFICLKPR